MRHLMVMSALLLLFPQIAHADSLFLLEDNNAALLLDSGTKDINNTSHYLEHFYANCLSKHKTPELSEYAPAQCACTIAKIDEHMNLEDMRDLSSESTDGNFQYARMLELAYIPCMKDQIENYAFDYCLYDNPRERSQLRKPVKTCQCVGKGMANYTMEKAHWLIPGFYQRATEDSLRFDRNKTVGNPFESVINDKGFAMKTNYHYSVCSYRYEYNN